MDQKNGDYLSDQLRELMSKEDPLTQQIIDRAVELVRHKNLSVEALSKKLERDIDKLL